MRFMMVAVGLMNSLIRILGDPYLRYKLWNILVTRRCGTKHIDDNATDCDLGSEPNETLTEPPSPNLAKRDTSAFKNLRLS